MVQSVGRALSLLTEVARDPAGLTELAGRSGLALSTASRLLGTLEQGGAVSRSDDGVYEIGPVITAMNPVVDTAGASLQSISYPYLSALSAELTEAACLSVPMGRERLTLVQVDVPRPVRAEDWTGDRWPIAAGGSGLVLMATWSIERVMEVLGEDPLPPELDEVRERGVAWTHGDYVEGLSSVAAAVVSPDGVGRASVMAYGPSYRFPLGDSVRDVEQAVRRCAREISTELASGWSNRMEHP